MLWKRLVTWLNLGVLGFSIFMAMGLPAGMAALLLVEILIASSAGTLVVAALSFASKEQFSPQLVKLFAAMTIVANVCLGIFAVVGLVVSGAAPTPNHKVAVFLLGVAVANLSYLAVQYQSLGRPESPNVD